MAVNHAGDVAAAWVRSTKVWSSIYRSGGGWSQVTVISAAPWNTVSINKPGIGIDAAGNVTGHWAQVIPLNNSIGYKDEIYVTTFQNSTGAWGTPELIKRQDSSSLLVAKLAVSASGDAIVVWSSPTISSDVLSSYRPTGGSWGRATAVNATLNGHSKVYPDVGMDDDGNAIVVFRDAEAAYYPDGTSRSRNFASRYDKSQGGFSPQVLLSNDSLGDTTNPAIYVTGSGNAFAIYRQYAVERSGAPVTYLARFAVPLPVNQPPVANAGADQNVTEGAAVTLDGTASNDPEGNLVSYQWTQTAGPAVTLTNATSAVAGFTAPAVTQNTNLTFVLTVTDDVGQTGTDTVTVMVQPQGGGGDTTAPVTTGIFNRSVIKGKVVFAITLSANEPSTTHFRLTGQGTVSGGGSNTTAWQIYSGPVTVNLAKNGAASFDYYSDDPAGNVEATQTEVLQ